MCGRHVFLGKQCAELHGGDAMWRRHVCEPDTKCDTRSGLYSMYGRYRLFDDCKRPKLYCG